MARFIGRKIELNALTSWSQRSQISAIYGRRRIGKTRLVEEAAKGFKFIKFEGLEAQSQANQRRHFRDTLARYSGSRSHALATTSNWEALLILLSEYIEKEPIIVLFDEFQWMAGERQELVSTLKYVWDNYFLKNNRVHLIICGSVSSFIVKKVVQSKALFGRIDLKINLGPLRLKEVWDGFFPKWSLHEVVKMYMVLGGVPKYLELCQSNKSFEQNVLALFFSPVAPLLTELDSLFVSHFGKNTNYVKALSYLSLRKYASRTEILERMDKHTGGGISTILSDLEMAGFIEVCPFIRGFKKSKAIHYRICDPFLRFFYKFVNPRAKKIKSITVPMNILEALPLQSVQVWQGFAFEAVCHSHADLIANALGFGAVEYEYGSIATGSNQAEIDLVFSRNDGVITICEIKASKKVDASVLTQVQSQIESLQGLSKKTVNAALISAGVVDKNVIESRLFTAILGLEALVYR